MKKIITRILALALSASIIFPVSAAVLSEPSTVPANTTEPSKENINTAIKDFKSLSRKERKDRVKEAKIAAKKFAADKKSGKAADSDTNKVLLVILAILLPPLAVFLHEDEINTKFWLSLVLTLLFWIPGVIYAMLVVLDVI